MVIKVVVGFLFLMVDFRIQKRGEFVSLMLLYLRYVSAELTKVAKQKKLLEERDENYQNHSRKRERLKTCCGPVAVSAVFVR